MVALMIQPLESAAVARRAPGILPRAVGLRRWQEAAKRGRLGASSTSLDRAILVERGQPAATAFLLSEGSIELLQRHQDGQSVVFKILVAPTLFGVIELLAGEPEYLSSVRILGKAQIYRCTPPALRQLIESDAELAHECLVDTGRAFCVTSRLASIGLYDTETQLANLLSAYLDLFGHPVAEGVRIGLRRSQADLAGSIGAGERSINRVLGAWRREGLIFKRAGHYVVTDPAAMAERAGELRNSLIHTGGDAQV